MYPIHFTSAPVKTPNKLLNYLPKELRYATQLKARACELASGACITKLIIGYHLTCNTGSSTCMPQLPKPSAMEQTTVITYNILSL
jgi:hypothetical protein